MQNHPSGFKLCQSKMILGDLKNHFVFNGSTANLKTRMADGGSCKPAFNVENDVIYDGEEEVIDDAHVNQMLFSSVQID